MRSSDPHSRGCRDRQGHQHRNGLEERSVAGPDPADVRRTVGVELFEVDIVLTVDSALVPTGGVVGTVVVFTGAGRAGSPPAVLVTAALRSLCRWSQHLCSFCC
ncbi:hypothetical protein [Methanosphaerula subterraneus]|uniref:hypothetical protein n=1 Tax=Methanosphaerula subterraneus TaxID=3350244 RepID=UPI003F83C3AD